MKIGILTYHRVINDGSVVQAYCLQNLLLQLFPDAGIEIVDYRSRRSLIDECRFVLNKYPPFFNAEGYRKVRNFRKFIRQNLLLSPKSCVTDRLETACTFVARQKYDAIFVGSDTVWEARFGAYAPNPPNIFYLPHIKGVIKVAFAASADPVRPEFLENRETLARLGKHIADFDYISVRDDATIQYLTGLGIEADRIRFLPDPTCLYDFGHIAEAPDWEHLKPLAGVSIGGKLREAVVPQLRENGYNIIDLRTLTVNGMPSNELNDSLNRRLGVYQLLDFMVTDRFHSSLFTLILAEAPVLMVETAEKWPQPNGKGRDLFQRLGIEPMVWRHCEKEEVPDNLIKTSLMMWQTLKPDIKGQFAAVKQKALCELETIGERLL
jgi:hypothetical protein